MKFGRYFLHMWAFFIFVFMAGCTQPVPPQFASMEITGINQVAMNATAISANLHFYNPNSANMKMTHAEVMLSLENKPVGQCIIDSTINIPKMDSFYVPIVFTANVQNVLNNALQILLSGQVKANAEGFVKLKKSGIGFTVPVHYEETIPLNKLINQ